MHPTKPTPRARTESNREQDSDGARDVEPTWWSGRAHPRPRAGVPQLVELELRFSASRSAPSSAQQTASTGTADEWRTNWRTEAKVPANRHVRAGLENRFGLLGPTRVQIPPF